LKAIDLKCITTIHLSDLKQSSHKLIVINFTFSKQASKLTGRKYTNIDYSYQTQSSLHKLNIHHLILIKATNVIQSRAVSDLCVLFFN